MYEAPVTYCFIFSDDGCLFRLYINFLNMLDDQIETYLYQYVTHATSYERRTADECDEPARLKAYYKAMQSSAGGEE